VVGRNHNDIIELTGRSNHRGTRVDRSELYYNRGYLKALIRSAELPGRLQSKSVPKTSELVIPLTKVTHYLLWFRLRRAPRRGRRCFTSDL